jgi:hypothetical protein
MPSFMDLERNIRVLKRAIEVINERKNANPDEVKIAKSKAVSDSGFFLFSCATELTLECLSIWFSLLFVTLFSELETVFLFSFSYNKQQECYQRYD